MIEVIDVIEITVLRRRKLDDRDCLVHDGLGVIYSGSGKVRVAERFTLLAGDSAELRAEAERLRLIPEATYREIRQAASEAARLVTLEP